MAPHRPGVSAGFVVLDTDVASLSIKRRLPPSLLAQLVENSVCITFVTLGELTKWVEMRRWGSKNRDAIGGWLDRAMLLPYSRRVATTWGELQAAAAHRGRTPPHNDTWIAACCLVEGLPLATRNVRDYVGFAEYDGLVLVGD
jgi:toxin FitB